MYCKEYKQMTRDLAIDVMKFNFEFDEDGNFYSRHKGWTYIMEENWHPFNEDPCNKYNQWIMIFKKLIDSGFSVNINLLNEDSPIYKITVENSQIKINTESSSIPEAICLAALGVKDYLK